MLPSCVRASRLSFPATVIRLHASTCFFHTVLCISHTPHNRSFGGFKHNMPACFVLLSVDAAYGLAMCFHMLCLNHPTTKLFIHLHQNFCKMFVFAVLVFFSEITCCQGTKALNAQPSSPLLACFPLPRHFFHHLSTHSTHLHLGTNLASPMTPPRCRPSHLDAHTSIGTHPDHSPNTSACSKS
jgi:hypothetical protein